MATVLVNEGLVADNSLERATLTRASAKKLHAQYSAATTSPKGDGSSAVFWLLVAVLLFLALSNIALTFFAMGVLRLGAGMESVEFITGPQRMLKFFGITDLGIVQQQNGLLSSYAGEPLSLTGVSGQVSLAVNTIKPSPAVHIAQHSVHIVNVNRFQIINPETSDVVFSSDEPNFGVPKGVRHLDVLRTQTPRIVSPTHSNLDIRADSTVKVKGNEGVSMQGRTLEWNADQDIYLRSLNGSLVLDGGAGGVFVEVNNLPLAGPVDHSKDRGQYKLCVCRRGRGATNDGHLYRVPVPLDNTRRSREHQINCASFTNPCM